MVATVTLSLPSHTHIHNHTLRVFALESIQYGVCSRHIQCKAGTYCQIFSERQIKPAEIIRSLKTRYVEEILSRVNM